MRQRKVTTCSSIVKTLRTSLNFSEFILSAKKLELVFNRVQNSRNKRSSDLFPNFAAIQRKI